jgi:hypothetical protein
MNRSNLKTYAPAARRDFIQAVKDRAVMYGLSAKKIEPMTERGDVVLIAGQPFPKTVALKRKRLEERIAAMGFERAMEAIAYSWFNRFVAIRFMELHGYLDHGYRVLSHPSGDVQPEILEHAQRVDFPGLDKNKVVELKLDGTKQEDLYRLLLVAQCNALSQAMPFLFERIDDETELLLPSNLLATDSLIQKLVKEIDEEDWKEVEIIGWLYQFYISERKDEVIGKVVASEDIPAATQLFTPNWIVKYLVQNTLGRIWLATYPQSSIRQQMEFYIEPAEQTPEVQEQLKAITPASLNLEELTLLDPACGSAHILVEAYDLFKAIYQERGYRAKDIPGLILSKNLYGLEIDDRAAQLAAFALLMKARADDRRILESGIQPNILAFVESKGMDAGAITHALNSPIDGGAEGTITKADIAALIGLFEEATTFGSLIEVPGALAETLPAIEERLAAVLKDGDLTHAQAAVIAPLLRQARLLTRHYDAVVANPPYMGSKYLPPMLKQFVGTHFSLEKADLYACFLSVGFRRVRASGLIGYVTMHSWMFLSSFEDFRSSFVRTHDVITMLHLGPRAFDSISGHIVQVAAFVATAASICRNGRYLRLVDGDSVTKETSVRSMSWPSSSVFTRSAKHFQSIPGTRLAYWISPQQLAAFADSIPVSEVAEPKQGMATADNDRFVRMWFEVATDKTGLDYKDRNAAKHSGKKWFPYNKGGEYRRWFGNALWVVNWEQDGRELCSFKRAAIRNPNYYFREGITWTTTGFGQFGVRYTEPGFLFDVKGSSCFCEPEMIPLLLGLFSSAVCPQLLNAFNPTSENQVGNIAELPVLRRLLESDQQECRKGVGAAITLAREDWNSQEVSWGFGRSPLFIPESRTLADSFQSWVKKAENRIAAMRQVETGNNSIFIQAYALQDELSPEVPDDQITLYRPDREEDIKRLLSYAVGCMMGRYSLDKEGLIYAHSGNEGFDPSQYTRFPADDDGIVPVTEAPWFDEDAASRFERFVKTVWPAETLEENLAFVAESLGEKKSETPRETIRRYFAGDFYKHHLQTYKNRPIYWLFSSGKQGAFEALVYLHRYNEGTLSRMRTEYVVPLMGQMNGRLGMLADTIAKATSSKQRKDAEKEKDKLTKQLAELQAFDEKLRHYADQRIKLDLDDGVRVNYAKFGDLLADVKKVCGKVEDD